MEDEIAHQFEAAGDVDVEMERTDEELDDIAGIPSEAEAVADAAGEAEEAEAAGEAEEAETAADAESAGVAEEPEAAADAQAAAVLAAAEAEAAAILAAVEAEGVNICSVCSLPWTDNGAHRICCIPCGHVFGRSCLEAFFQEDQISSRCPTCNQPFGLLGIVTLFSSTELFENCCDIKALKAQMLQEFGRSMARYRADFDADLQRQEEVLRTQLHKEMNMLYARVMAEVDDMLSRKK